jgi:hypothetical protein
MDAARVSKSTMKRQAAYDEDPLIRVKKQEALQYILEAWEEALADGGDPYLLANAAIFAALSDMISVHGEEAVGQMTDSLSQRIDLGEFSLNRVTQ